MFGFLYWLWLWLWLWFWYWLFLRNPPLGFQELYLNFTSQSYKARRLHGLHKGTDLIVP
jgi:hypothetical protein